LNLPRIARTLLIVALAASIGLHWMLIQSIAWVGMFKDFSQHNSITTAVAMTFDGNHPCPLCLAVQSTENTEHKPQKAPLLKGKDLTCLALSEFAISLPVTPTALAEKYHWAPSPPPVARTDTPPLPPPRSQV